MSKYKIYLNEETVIELYACEFDIDDHGTLTLFGSHATSPRSVCAVFNLNNILGFTKD